jgi:hypothetical protein
MEVTISFEIIQKYTVLLFCSEDEETTTPEKLVFIYQLQDVTSTCTYMASFICLRFVTCFCFHSGNSRLIGQQSQGNKLQVLFCNVIIIIIIIIILVTFMQVSTIIYLKKSYFLGYIVL